MLVGKLAARMQAREDDLDAGQLFARMLIHRHAAPVIRDRDRAVPVQTDLDLRGITGNGLVHAVIHDLLHQMIGPAGVGVHAGALTHRIKPG